MYLSHSWRARSWRGGADGQSGGWRRVRGQGYITLGIHTIVRTPAFFEMKAELLRVSEWRSDDGLPSVLEQPSHC